MAKSTCDQLIQASVNSGEHSPQWTFIIDLLVCKPIDCVDGVTDIYHAMRNANYGSFMEEGVQRIKEAKGIQPSSNRCKETELLLICGFFAVKACDGHDDCVKYPWVVDRCQYHRHTEVDQPCYKDKR